MLKFDGVKQAVVFAVPSALRNEEPVACLTVDSGFSGKRELAHFCHTKLSAWQVPKDFWIVPEIPTNERGKHSPRELARRYLAEHPRPKA